MNTTPEFPANTPNSSIPDESAPASSETHLLDDAEYLLHQASGGKRFANYLIDTVIFYFAWRLFVAQWFGVALYYLHFPLDNITLLYIVAYLGAYFFFGLIVGGFEAATGGKTIGKYITRTRAVTDNGVRIGPKKALLRFLVRQVPFEAFSALGSPSYPWHDRWTKTLVIDEKLTTLPPQD
jgi:uncharacterized RDD family membrane protein YckC